MPVNQIVEQLKSEEARLKAAAEKLKQQVKHNESELTRIQSALAALGNKPAGKASRKTLKPAPTKVDVIAAMESALADNRTLDTDALKAIVQEAVSDSGKSKQGFALRFAEAIKHERFVESAEGYRLVQPHHESNATV